MIVLDEQLQGRGVEDAIARWYPGTVCFITDLRPGTVIKDEAIPALLARENGATFVTINVGDFWQRVAITDHFCVACFALSDPAVDELPSLLHRLLRCQSWSTKAKRMGKVARITTDAASYYTAEDRVARPVDEWRA